jgi:hypothetical protein
MLVAFGTHIRDGLIPGEWMPLLKQFGLSSDESRSITTQMVQGQCNIGREIHSDWEKQYRKLLYDIEQDYEQCKHVVCSRHIEICRELLT